MISCWERGFSKAVRGFWPEAGGDAVSQIRCPEVGGAGSGAHECGSLVLRGPGLGVPPPSSHALEVYLTDSRFYQGP